MSAPKCCCEGQGCLPGAAHAGLQAQPAAEGAAVLIWQGLVNNYTGWEEEHSDNLAQNRAK